jgi:hypothetical protein
MPFLPYLLIAAGLFSTLALFLALKKEIRTQAQRQQGRVEAMAARLQDAECAIPRAELETFAIVPAPLRAGLNLNKRVHAMRMLRRGEDVAHIAAALGVPRREVELMIRVQSIGKSRTASAGSDAQ